MQRSRGARYDPLTRLFKPITTALWHGRGQTGRQQPGGEPEFSRRQMEAGRIAAGSGRAWACPQRLDPFSLPVRFEAADEAADERRCVVDLHRERVVLRRSVRGMRMALNMPVTAFRGVAIRLCGEFAGNSAPTSIAVVLEHPDPALSLPLFCVAGSRRHRRRMAVLGPRARAAAFGRRRRRQFARAVRAARRAAHRGADLAPPPPQRDRAAPAVAAPAPPPRQTAGSAAGASRRARDHRAELVSSRAAPRRAASRRTGSARRRGRI